MKTSSANWFLPAMRYSHEPGTEIGRISRVRLPRLVLTEAKVDQPCRGCDAPATGWDAHATPWCCDTCRQHVETPTKAECRCAFKQSQIRVAGGQS